MIEIIEVRKRFMTMTVIKCKVCGREMKSGSNGSVVECEYCGSRQMIPTEDHEKEPQFAGAGRQRIDCELAKAQKRLEEQRQIYAANERKIFGAGARAKKEALEEIRRLESKIGALKEQQRQPLSMQTLSQSVEADEHDPIGDSVKFGTYPQTAEGSDKTPIEWRVLAREGNRALLLSRYGLDVQLYHTKSTEMTWEKCTLRKWLNDDFIDRAFTEEQRDAILLTNVDNSVGQGYGKWNTTGGKDTQDKVFLLSYAEANRYLGVTYDDDDNLKPRVVPTAYAIAQGAGTHEDYQTLDGADAGWWWLRSPGSGQRAASVVSCDGSLNCILVRCVDACVRPALWVDLDSGIV